MPRLAAMFAEGVLREEKLVQKLSSVGIYTVEDMLSYDAARFTLLCRDVYL
jgi:uncharacterized protein YjfI (DUF2170 family)